MIPFVLPIYFSNIRKIIKVVFSISTLIILLLDIAFVALSKQNKEIIKRRLYEIF